MPGKYETFAERHFTITNRSGNEYMVRCVFHEDGNASMQFNVEKGLFVCFSCGASGNIKTLERHFGIRVMEDMMDVSDIRARLDALKNPEKDILPVLPESHLKRYSFPTTYWEGRGFTDTVVASFDLGYDPIGDHQGEFVTIPIRDINGGLLGVIKRYLDPDAELRYRYPKGFKRSLNLFASWMVAQDEEAHTVALCEGSLDAVKCWQAGVPAMAVYGSSVSPSQARILRRLGIGSVVLFFDNDKAGYKANSAARGFHERKRGRTKKWEYDPRTDLSRDFLLTKANYRGLPSDPGAMDEEQILRAIRRATPVS